MQYMALRDAMDSEVTIEYCETEGALRRTLAAGSVAAVLWDYRPHDGQDLPYMIALLHRVTPGIPLLLHVDLSREAVRQIVAIAAADPSPHILLRGADDVRAALIRAVHTHDAMPTAQRELSRILLPQAPASAADLVAAAIAAGHRRLSVGRFAALCGLASRTVEWRLQAACMPPPRTLLGWMLALHGLWRVDVLGRPMPQVAGASGFTSTRTWATYIQRQTGERPAALLARGGFRILVRVACHRLGLAPLAPDSLDQMHAELATPEPRLRVARPGCA